MRVCISHTDFGDHHDIGGKAGNLLKLGRMGVPVPSWVVVPARVMLDQLPGNIPPSETAEHFEKLQVPDGILEDMKSAFGPDPVSKTYAVRSSALDEDGSKFSFAGQFETFLHVKFEDIPEKILAIWRSVVSERVQSYRSENKLAQQLGIGVVIQEMISPDAAGVGFGIDPVSGDEKSKIISAVYGLGEGLVSGELDADTYTLKNGTIDTALATKTHSFVRAQSGEGIVKIEVAAEKADVACLREDQLKEISSLLDKLNTELGGPQDIEFAYANNQLFLLQTRPVTAAGNAKEGEYILWDNSNIIESYPGITTPLTFSFILKMYEMVYRQFVELMGANKTEIESRKDVFSDTLGLVRGRVYYNLLSWYKMLAMLPGYSINAEFMEGMMGVKERFDLPEDYQMSKGTARLRILGMVFRMIRKQITLPRERRKFQSHLDRVMAEYRAIDFDSISSAEIISRYYYFETSLLLEWKAPLINDFFAMIWFGLLQKQTAKLCPDSPNIHNDLLCGSQDIISVEPIHKCMDISSRIQDDAEAKNLFANQSPTEVWKALETGSFPSIKSAIDDYIQYFGERCVGELKLETISYSQDPSRFVKIIQSYVAQEISQGNSSRRVDNQLREEAQKIISEQLKGKPIKRWVFRLILRKARDLVSNRENLRYQRTRGFGMVRTMFSALGKKWQEQGKLTNDRDVFYLLLEEIKSASNGEFKPEWMDLITERKREFENYNKEELPQERFFTYGHNFTDEYIYSTDKLEPIEGDLSGTGCCPGRVQGKVRVVLDPNEIDSLNGDILVTSSTDPGWVTLFPTSSAIIVERGSLLSHSAIVSREMGIPCIVSVTGLLRTLQTGDEIIMDGSTGKIEIVK